MEGGRQNGEWDGAPGGSLTAGQGRAGPEKKPRLCQESRPPDKAGAKAGLRVGQELSQRVGIRSK